MTPRRCAGRARSRRAAYGLLGCIAAALLACQPDTPPPLREQGSSLEQGVVAQVGADRIDVVTVAAIASAQGIGREQARARAIQDALFAAGARERRLDRSASAKVAARGVLADTLLERISAEAAATPATREEVERFTALHWADLDRPETYSTVHAVAMVRPDDDAQKHRNAMELARRIAAAVKGVSDADEFMTKAKEAAAQDRNVQVEKLDPVTADGRVAAQQQGAAGQPTTTYAGDFVAAVLQLHKPGDQSPPIQTSFGYHVIMLLEVRPARVVAYEQRSKLLGDEIRSSRAKAQLDSLLAGLRNTIPTRVERNADTILGMLPTAAKDQ